MRNRSQLTHQPFMRSSSKYIPNILLSSLLTLAWMENAAAAPAISTISPVAGNTLGVLTNVSVTFNEVVVGVDATDLEINGQAALSVSGANAGPYIFISPNRSRAPYRWPGTRIMASLAWGRVLLLNQAGPTP